MVWPAKRDEAFLNPNVRETHRDLSESNPSGFGAKERKQQPLTQTARDRETTESFCPERVCDSETGAGKMSRAAGQRFSRRDRGWRRKSWPEVAIEREKADATGRWPFV
jgi:hypothetical protein